jgi:hypothetical protein
MDATHIRAIAEAVADGDKETRRQLEERCASLERRMADQAEAHAAAMIELRAMIDQARAELGERATAAEQGTVVFLEADRQRRDALRDELAAAVLQIRAERVDAETTAIAEHRRQFDELRAEFGAHVDGTEQRAVAFLAAAGDSQERIAATIAEIRKERAQPVKVELDQPMTWDDMTVTMSRGCVVTHQGSTFVANREAYGSPSDEPQSWSLIAAGFLLLGAEQTGDREVTLKFRNGFDTVQLVVPFAGAPLYRGLWEDARAYETGDLVTLDGSMWACLADTDTRPPGEAWRLAVKRGERARALRATLAPAAAAKAVAP